MNSNVTSYGRRLTEIATDRPDDVDLIIAQHDHTERHVTWRELESRANQIGRALADQGVKKDSVVCLALPTCVEHIFVTLAIWKLGATLLPLRHDQPQWEMNRLLDMAKPAALVSDTHTPTMCPVLTRSDLAATTALSADPLPDAISEIVNLGASSGSTGHPKLIVVPLRGVVDDGLAIDNAMRSHNSVMLIVSPLYHVNGFSFVSPKLLEGNRVVVMEKFDAAHAVELIERHQATYTVMVPTMLQRIARLDGIGPQNFASLQTLVYGGASIPEWVVDRWLTLVPPEVFLLTYGSTERLGLFTMTGADWLTHRGATGRPIDVEISVRDAAGNPLLAGEVGELWMRPLDPTRPTFQYVGQPTPTPTSDGFLTIGDLARVDEDNYVYIVDRRTDMIVTGGANVFPAEVEAALSEHPAVVDQVVVGVPDDEWGHRVHAIIQHNASFPPPSADALRAWCKDRLASYKVPKTFEFTDALPRTAAGKLNRTALGAQRGSGEASATI